MLSLRPVALSRGLVTAVALLCLASSTVRATPPATDFGNEYVCLSESFGNVPGDLDEYLCVGISPGSGDPAPNLELQLKPHFNNLDKDLDHKKTRFLLPNLNMADSGQVRLKEFDHLCWQHQGSRAASANTFVTLQPCDETEINQYFDLRALRQGGMGSIRPYFPPDEVHNHPDMRSPLCLLPARCSSAEGGSTNDATGGSSTWCPKEDATSVTDHMPIKGSYLKMFLCDEGADSTSPISIVDYHIEGDSINTPSFTPTFASEAPTTTPTHSPSHLPSRLPSSLPTLSPTSMPSPSPSLPLPSSSPTQGPSTTLSHQGLSSDEPTSSPSTPPTSMPTTAAPSLAPTTTPSALPTSAPSSTISTTAPSAVSAREADTLGTQSIARVRASEEGWPWLFVVILGFTLLGHVMLSGMLVRPREVRSAMASAGYAVGFQHVLTAFDSFEVISLAQFMVLAAQLDLPSVPAAFYNFSKMFAWTTLHVDMRNAVPLDDAERLFAADSTATGRGLAQTEFALPTSTYVNTTLLGKLSGLERYSLALGVSPRSLLPYFLVRCFP
jgi:hypothetical protein